MNFILTIIFILNYPIVSISNDDFNKLKKNNPYVYFKEDNNIGFLANKNTINFIEKNNINYEVLYENEEEYQRVVKSVISNENFVKYNQILLKMDEITKKYPDVFEMISLGNTEENREIYALKTISNNNKPRYRIAGGIHGDEAMSYQFVYDFMNYIVDNQDSYQKLINNTELWFIPMLNPDACISVKRRNSNNIDLNRNLGFYFEETQFSDSPFSQRESKAIRDNTIKNNFTISFSYHTYGDYINYVWNFSPDIVSDHDEILYLSNMYQKYNENYKVTKGYDWYRTTGDLNDYSYGTVGNIDWTIEIKDSDRTGEVFENNKNALLEILNTNEQGIEGRVYDEFGNELEAVLSVLPKNNLFYSFDNGYYYRYLLEGVYKIKVKSNNYKSIEKEFIVKKNKRTKLDIKLKEKLDFLNAWKVIKIENNFKSNERNSLSKDILFEDNVFFKIQRNARVLLEVKLSKDKNYRMEIISRNKVVNAKISTFEKLDSEAMTSFYYNTVNSLYANTNYIEIENKSPEVLEIDGIKIYELDETPRMISTSCGYRSKDEFYGLVIFFILICFIYRKKIKIILNK